MPQISVIVPVYKVEPYLHRCVDSILAQTFTDFELILVDDGSPDNCGAICEEYAERDSRIKVIHKKNGGLSSARNAGLDAASGEYILFCDSDDFVSKFWIESMLREAVRFQDSLVVCGVKKVDPGFSTKEEPDVLESQDIRYIDLFLKGLSGYVCNKIYRRAFIESIGLRFDERIRFAEDIPFNVQYSLKLRKYRIISAQLYFYTQVEGSILHVYRRDLLGASLQPFFCRIPLLQPEDLGRYCAHWMFQFCNMFEVVFDQRNSGMSFMEKMRYNQKMVNTEEFQFCVHHADTSKENQHLISPLKNRNYYLYWLIMKGSEIKRKLRGRQ